MELQKMQKMVSGFLELHANSQFNNPDFMFIREMGEISYTDDNLRSNLKRDRQIANVDDSEPANPSIDARRTGQISPILIVDERNTKDYGTLTFGKGSNF